MWKYYTLSIWSTILATWKGNYMLSFNTLATYCSERFIYGSQLLFCYDTTCGQLAVKLNVKIFLMRPFLRRSTPTLRAIFILVLHYSFFIRCCINHTLSVHQQYRPVPLHCDFAQQMTKIEYKVVWYSRRNVLCNMSMTSVCIMSSVIG